MNIFYYFYTYLYTNRREEQSLEDADEMLKTSLDVASVLDELREVELDVDADVLSKVMAFARQA